MSKPVKRVSLRNLSTIFLAAKSEDEAERLAVEYVLMIAQIPLPHKDEHFGPWIERIPVQIFDDTVELRRIA